jgi:predicted RNase H-like HicB family nuclease
MTMNGRENNESRYSMLIEWSPEDGVYIVTVPELPGCRTHGSTREEAVRMGEEVIELWLEGDGPAPPPRTFTYWSNLDHIVLTPIKVDAPQDAPVESRSA